MLQNLKKQSESVLQEILHKMANYNILNMLQILIKAIQYFSGSMYKIYFSKYATTNFLYLRHL